MRPLSTASMALAIFGALAATACPTGGQDDDDSADSTPGPEDLCDVDPDYNSPVITTVDPCECPDTVDRCEELGAQEGAFQSRWAITVTDVDGDLINPRYFLGVDFFPPYSTGRLEGTLGDGGTLNVDVPCNLFTRNTNVEFHARIVDQAGCESAPFEDLWLVPEREGDDTCAAACSPF